MTRRSSNHTILDLPRREVRKLSLQPDSGDMNTALQAYKAREQRRRISRRHEDATEMDTSMATGNIVIVTCLIFVIFGSVMLIRTLFV